MDDSLRNRTALVTGAGSGMGRAHAELLAERGAHVVVQDVVPERTETVAGAIRAAGGSAEPLPGDAAGTGAPEGDRSRGVELRSFNMITPETDRSCFYFYTHVRNFALTEEQVDERVKSLFREAFLEDKTVIEGVQRGNERFPDSPRVDAAFDWAPMMARRVVERRARQEAMPDSRVVAAE